MTPLLVRSTSSGDLNAGAALLEAAKSGDQQEVGILLDERDVSWEARQQHTASRRPVARALRRRALVARLASLPHAASRREGDDATRVGVEDGRAESLGFMRGARRAAPG